jgi:DUF218 domain-containing protein
MPERASRWRDAGSGFVLGVLLALAALQLTREVLPGLGTDLLLPLGGILGALLGPTRARAALPTTGAVLVAIMAVIGYTPLASLLIRGVIRSDPPAPVPAVVVLASTLQKDRELSDSAQARLVHGYELIGQRYAPRLVLTRLTWRPYSYVPTVRRQLVQLGLHPPIDEVGPVSNTHDEAVAVARLARERGWDHVLLVTHPWHMRRAAALFEKQGLHVTCSPCVEGEYDLSNLGSPSARLHAFRDWAHEAIGLFVYRLRGWI